MTGYLEDFDEEFGRETASPLRDFHTPDDLPPFEVWADRLFYQAIGEGPDGRAYGHHGRCTATAKTTGERCRQPARGDRGKCYYHGGAKGSGIGDGQTDHAAEAIRNALERDLVFEARSLIGEKGHVRP